MAFVDFDFRRQFIETMKPQVPPDALRAARSLVGLSQSDVASGSGLTRAWISKMEAGKERVHQANLTLRLFYEDMGIEFLGTLDVGSGERSGIGARWRPPPGWPERTSESTGYHTERNGVAFLAARALAGLDQLTVARDVDLHKTVLARLETGSFEPDAGDRLRQYYEAAGIEFLGWGDVSENLHYGVGVRWKPSR
ncbi:helix-turn-helix domain-containing protein [Rhizobium pisi]|uniref:helix-turn-helix domain-containing protein n=1 Tax=Rhizobium pisi TaxID=574561 RepID=UPI0039B037E7